MAEQQLRTRASRLEQKRLQLLLNRNVRDMTPEEYVQADPDSQLERQSSTSITVLKTPHHFLDKVFRLTKDFGHKKDLQRYGRFVMQIIRSRTSAEIPKYLPSRFLPDDDVGRNRIDRIIQDPIYQASLAGEEEIVFDEDGNPMEGGHGGVDKGRRQKVVKTMENLARLAKAHAEDTRHKLYQMFWSPEAALAYVAHRFPGAYASNFRVMHELKVRCGDFQPKSMLDYGCGPGPSIAAASELWTGFERVVGIDPSKHMAQLAQYLLADFVEQQRARNPAMASTPATVQWQSSLYEQPTGPGHGFDLITVSYVQMEIRGQPSRDMLIKNLWNRLNPGGVLVLIERGTPTGFRFMHHTRELFLEEVGVEHFHFVAPCSHEGMCPMALTGRDWCHFGQRLYRLPHQAYCKGSRSRFLEEEKFSFLAIRKAPGPRFLYKSEREAPTPWEKSYFWPRVVLPVIRRGGHALMDLCSSGGNITKCGPNSGKNKSSGSCAGCPKMAPAGEDGGEDVDERSRAVGGDRGAARARRGPTKYSVPNGLFERASTSKAKEHHMGYRFARKKGLWGDLWRFPKRVMRAEARPYIPDETRARLDRLARKAGQAYGLDMGEASGGGEEAVGSTRRGGGASEGADESIFEEPKRTGVGARRGGAMGGAVRRKQGMPRLNKNRATSFRRERKNQEYFYGS